MDEVFTPLDDLRTPLEITNRMQWVLHYLRKATYVINELRDDFVEKKNAYLKASKTFQISIAGQGSREDRENRAQIEHWELYEAMTVAEKALQFAREKKSDLEAELSAIQSETKLVIAEQQLAGRIGA
ncbi:hypothetical protein PBI_GAIA_83 [Mycobacterium phage Gaia]|uniref:Uncharacterized protein n=1 Tax=Mycobacterium phage Gaia TaxID=1486472 RepID=A0A068F1S8_9CAUD|nr:hypothetical protein VC46_gp150 [Mycobacterium phage Gaia]AID58902.1 hypothetical protein PBI_GAIA_83 [Mycobacterium phage Gaia]AYR00021.1 hypothetical protein PBI_NEBKISS_82 [Mycobacterium phage Nebkiss]